MIVLENCSGMFGDDSYNTTEAQDSYYKRSGKQKKMNPTKFAMNSRRKKLIDRAEEGVKRIAESRRRKLEIKHCKATWDCPRMFATGLLEI